MRTNKFITALLSLLLLAATAISLASCNKDDDPKESENNNANPGNHSGQNTDSLVRYFNDLEYFQGYFVQTDSAGNFLYRSMGEPLYESDTAHLYIGVDDIDEALKYFEYAIAPDIAKQTSVSNNYVYTLTDTSGNELGTVSFVPGSGTSVAEITTDLPGLKYFNKVTFLQNDAWPHNSGAKVWHKGDVRTFSIADSRAHSVLNMSDIMHQWVLIREPGNGVPPLWVTTTNDVYESATLVRWFDYSPNNAQAKEIYKLLSENWNAYQSVLPHIREHLWIYGALTFDFIDMSSGVTDYYIDHPQIKYRYLLKIDWNIDWLVKEPQGIYTIIAASSGGKNAAKNVFDGNTRTQWKTFDREYSRLSGEICWFLEFMTTEPINPTAYYMTTGDNTKQFPGCNPRIWNIYAKKNPGDAWVLIDKRDNTDYPRDRMENANFWTGWWGVSVGKEMYQYFRLEMIENWNLGYFQISEFGFQYNENVEIDENELYYTVVDASDGYPGNLALNLFDGNLDTKWCVDKGNKSKTPLHDGKCWYVEFKASKPITPAGFYMTTASDHTVFPDRAPRIWNLYGLKDGWWTLIASYDNTDTQREQMTNADKWTGNWGINVAPGEYQYFRLEMYENWGADCFQISELGFYF